MNKKIIFALVIMGLLAVSAANAQNSLILNNNGDDSMYQTLVLEHLKE